MASPTIIRRCFTLAGILTGAAIVLGCMSGPNEVEYPGGVTFTGWSSSQFETVCWGPNANNAGGCPLTIHLPGGDIGGATLADPQALKARGWVAEGGGNNVSQMTWQDGDLVAWANYNNNALFFVGVSTRTRPAVTPGLVSVSGKRLPLPVTDDELVSQLGQPARRAVRR